MKKKLLLVILFPLLLIGCKDSVNNKVENYIIEYWKSNSDQDSCILDLKVLLNFDWDKMYIFGEYTYPEDISKMIGFKYNGKKVRDNSKRVIFVKDNKVVFQETYDNFPARIFTFTTPYNPDKPINTDEPIKYETYKFKIKRNPIKSKDPELIKRGYGYFYYLYPI